MKKPLLLALLFFAAVFALTALAHATGHLRFNAFTALTIVGSLLALAVVPFACRDYRRKPRSRALRPSARAQSDDACACPLSLRPWSYQSHGTSHR